MHGEFYNSSFLIIVGVGAGLLCGMLGVGSGSLVVPLLVFIFSMTQKSAQGMALFVMVPMALVAAIRYKMNPDIEIDMYKTLMIIAGSLMGVFAGTAIAARLPDNTLRKIFAVFLLIIALKMLFGGPSSSKKEDKASKSETPKDAMLS